MATGTFNCSIEPLCALNFNRAAENRTHKTRIPHRASMVWSCSTVRSAFLRVVYPERDLKVQQFLAVTHIHAGQIDNPAQPVFQGIQVYMERFRRFVLAAILLQICLQRQQQVRMVFFIIVFK